MKLAVALAVVISSSAFAAPTDEILKERTKKSASIAPYGGGASYGGAASYGGSYGPPCAGGAPLAPIALYLAPQGAPHYREEEKEEERNEHARSYEGASYGASPAISLAPASSGAIGYFPHSKIGPCGVPLLLSCSPNVIAGHLAKSHGYAAAPSYAAPAYKQVEKKEETTELKEAMEKSWAEAEREANNNLGHHHHLIGLTDHHDALGEHAHNHELIHNHSQHVQNHNHNGPV